MKDLRWISRVRWQAGQYSITTTGTPHENRYELRFGDELLAIIDSHEEAIAMANRHRTSRLPGRSVELRDLLIRALEYLDYHLDDPAGAHYDKAYDAINKAIDMIEEDRL